MLRRVLFGFLAFVSLVCGQETKEPKRLALLLGNSAYKHLPVLADVPNDLMMMAAALKNAGFDVTLERDFTQDRLQTTTVLKFIEKIQPGDVCFFYFAGYAMQSQQDNYLLPVEFDPAKAQQDVSGDATSLTAIQQILDQKNAGLKILALEASRSNPSLAAQGVGLANPDAGATKETLFAFAAAPNHWSPEPSGIFTKALAAAIEKKGLSIDAIFREVAKQADAATGGKQQTYFLPNVTQEFFFHKPEKVPDPVSPPPPPRVIEVIKEVPQGRAAGTQRQNTKDKEDYVWIPAGDFLMGCVEKDDKCKPEEKPQHKVTISKGFWMGRNEVMTLSYERYVEADKKNRKMPVHGPYWDEKWKLPDSHYPMAELTADEASAYCSWAGGRLPTEAEWEYAARAGKPNQSSPLASDADSREQANFFGKAGNDKWEQAAPVGRFNASAWNLLDMAGNVWEWCSDWFSPNYYAESPAVDPQGPSAPAKDPKHVVRGGSWDSDAKQYLRISYREGHKAGNTVGFRCVLPDGPATDKLLGIR